MNAVSHPLASAPWQLGPRIPQTGRTALAAFGLAMLRAFGWKLTGAFPNIERFVAVIAPHTSNWDFAILLMAKWALRLDVRWMGKHAMFRGPLGRILKSMGGIPIERDRAHNVVDRSIREFARQPQMVLVLAPEGTRSKVKEWKSGFWHIAQGARVPIVCVVLDYGHKTIHLGPQVLPGNTDVAAGIAAVRAKFDGVAGKNPALQCDPLSAKRGLNACTFRDLCSNNMTTPSYF